MTLNILLFPEKIGEDVYRTKVLKRLPIDTPAGKGHGKIRKFYLMVSKAMIEEQELREGRTYSIRIKTIEGGIIENHKSALVVPIDPLTNYPMQLEIPGTAVTDGAAVYARITEDDTDYEAWFESAENIGLTDPVEPKRRGGRKKKEVAE